MKSGEMKLFDKNDNLVNTYCYDNAYYRNIMIGIWKKKYGKKFNELAIHYLPKEGQLLIKKDGTNAEHRKRSEKALSKLLTIDEY